MKRIAIIMSAAALMLSACGGSGEQTEKKGTAFAPKEKESTLSDSDRAAAIAAKKESLAGLNVDSMLMMDGVNFSVLPPEVNDNLPMRAVETLSARIMAIAGQNGVGGLCTNPVLGLISKVDCTERGMTSTAPQKAIAKYEVTFYCGNFITNDIYASATATVSGVAADFDQAAAHAFRELKNTPELKTMFRTASENALKWYNVQGNIENVVNKAVADQNYALAMAFLSSVPAQATATFEYATKRNAEVSDMFFQSKADELLGQMKAAIAASQGEYNPEAGAYYSLIPHNSKAYAEAEKAFAEYCKATEANRKDAIDRARAVEDRDALNAQLLAMEQLQVEKVKAPFEAQATIEQIKADARVGVAQANAEGKKNANTGGFLGMGKLWDGAFGIANRIMDGFDD